METSPSEPITEERKLEGVPAYQAALDELLAQAKHAVRIFDKQLEGRFDTRQRCELMSALLRAHRTNRIYVVLHDTGNIHRDCPRFAALAQQFSHAFFVRQTLPAARGVYDPFAVADEARFVRRFHYADQRGVASIGDINATHALLDRFNDIWEESRPALAATTLGL